LVNPIDPSIILQVNATVIAGVFIFLTIQYGKHDRHLEKVETLDEIKHPIIIIILFAASACFTLIPILYYISIILALAGFVYIIISLVYWFRVLGRIPYDWIIAISQDRGDYIVWIINIVLGGAEEDELPRYSIVQMEDILATEQAELEDAEQELAEEEPDDSDNGNDNGNDDNDNGNGVRLKLYFWSPYQFLYYILYTIIYE
jgi:hypothetical protein